MKYDLVQYSCDICGNLSEVLDPDQRITDFGWKFVFDDRAITHLCPECSLKYKPKQPENSLKED